MVHSYLMERITNVLLPIAALLKTMGSYFQEGLHDET